MSETLISDYIPVSVSTLQPREFAGINLYQRESDDGDFVLYRREDYPLGSEDLERLQQRGVHRLFIESAARDSYQDYLRSLIDPAIDHDNESLPARAGALNDVVRDVLETEFRSGATDQTVSEAARLGATTADIVCNDQFAASDLFRVLHHDYATFTHSANVAFYAAMLAAEMGHD